MPLLSRAGLNLTVGLKSVILLNFCNLISWERERMCSNEAW